MSVIENIKSININTLKCHVMIDLVHLPIRIIIDFSFMNFANALDSMKMQYIISRAMRVDMKKPSLYSLHDIVIGVVLYTTIMTVVRVIDNNNALRECARKTNFLPRYPISINIEPYID
ncbi:hypothetical protein BMH24_19560 [Serratia sp. OLJL1]|nr:hypothetical protein BMH24_19560 [Serratia sp. OLJL1]